MIDFLLVAAVVALLIIQPGATIGGFIIFMVYKQIMRR